MQYAIFFCLFFVNTIDIQATTHWMVTESGLIQPKEDSPYEISSPSHLIKFLNQEIFYDYAVNIYEELSKKQKYIDKIWTDIETKTNIQSLLLSDQNCMKAKPIQRVDWYIAPMDDGRSSDLTEDEFLLTTPFYGQIVDVPDCKKLARLKPAEVTSGHLKNIMATDNVTIEAEVSLPVLISSIMTIDQFGHWLTESLQENSSSWLHYNLASFYWRFKGNGPKAMECSRRAVFYAPRQYLGIALFGLGSILHRGKETNDAVKILRAAAKLDPRTGTLFTLANAYAVIGDYDRSLKYLEKCLEADKSHFAQKHKYAVMCHVILKNNLVQIGNSLDKIRNALSQYIFKEAFWIRRQADFLKNKKHKHSYDHLNIRQNCEVMGNMTNLRISNAIRKGDKICVKHCILRSHGYGQKWLNVQGVADLDSTVILQALVKHTNEHADRAEKYVLKLDYEGRMYKMAPLLKEPDIRNFKPTVSVAVTSKSKYIKTHFYGYNAGPALYPPTTKVRRNVHDFDKDPEWPSENFCLDTKSTFPPNPEAIYPVFLPFENKGISLKSLLSDKIGVPVNIEHQLPWHPPACPQHRDVATLTQKKSQKQLLTNEVMGTEYLRDKLLEYVGDGDRDLVKNMQDAEIGQRIYTIMEMHIAPKWLVYTLASLYWRVRGSSAHALHCLLTATRVVEPVYRDVVLASLASVYLEMGHFEEALASAEEAFKLSHYEPVTNFILYELNMAKKQKNTHMIHLKQVVRVEPDFMGGLARILLDAWSCAIKISKVVNDLEYGESDICAQLDGGQTNNMVCSQDGTNCQYTSNIQCFTSHERNSKTAARIMELRDENQSGDADTNTFDIIVENMPDDLTDRRSHLENYRDMMNIVTNTRGCGAKGCFNLRSEDVALKSEDCLYHHLQLGYWLRKIGFKKLLTDSNLRLPDDIPILAPSKKMLPECVVNTEGPRAFLLEQLSMVTGTEGWTPVPSLIRQFSGLFDGFDFQHLGSRFARFVETRPKQWLGLLGAGWWCGAGGHGACALRCLSAAAALAPAAHRVHVLRALAALLQVQSKQRDAKQVAYLTFYTTPKSKTEALLVAISHTYVAEFDQAIWMYRYALTLDPNFLPAQACLHATVCLMLFGNTSHHDHKAEQLQ